MEFMYFYQEEAVSTLSGKALELVDQFIYLGRNISSSESDAITHLVKVQTDIDRLSIISNRSDKIKGDFFQAVAVSILP